MWINRGLWMMTIGYLAVAAYGTAMGRGYENVTGPEMPCAAIGALMLVVARWRPVFAAAVAMSTVWLQLEMDVYAFGTFNNSSLIIFPLVVTVTGLLIGRRGAVVVGAISVIGIPLAGILGGVTTAHLLMGHGQEGLWLVVALLAVTVSTVLTYTALGSYGELLMQTERERARYLALFAQAPDGLLGIDTNGTILEANEAASRLLGQPREQMVGAALKAVLSRAGVGDEFDFTDAEQSQRLLELTVSRGVGDMASIEISVQGAHAVGTPSLLVLRDITQRKLIEQRIGHAQRLEAVGQLAGGIAHDFNNLLTAIGGSAEMLMAQPDPETRSFAEVILDAQRRGSSLTRQLLAFARRDVHQPTVIDLSATVGGMAKLTDRVLGEQHRLQIVQSGPLSINADAAQIEQVFLNLVTNARDAMAESGTIRCAIRELSGEGARALGSRLESDRQALLEVSDTGTGIQRELHAKIFEPFFTTKARGKGTGLGLAAVQGIVVQNQGSIALESVVGGGSTFRIFFPALQSAPRGGAPAPDAGAPKPEPQTGSGLKVLLVDDEDIVRHAAARMLRYEGYEVLVASNGEQALEILASNGPVNAVLTDLAMPGMNGRELGERIHLAHPQLPVVYMSGYFEEPGLPHSALVASAKSAVFLPKPFSTEQLLRTIRLAVGA